MRVRKGNLVLVVSILSGLCLAAWWYGRRAELEDQRSRWLPLSTGAPFVVAPGARATWNLDQLAWNERRGEAYLEITLDRPIPQGSIEFRTAATGLTAEGRPLDLWSGGGGPKHSIVEPDPDFAVIGIGQGGLDLSAAVSARFEVEVLSVTPEMPGLQATLRVGGEEDGSLLEAHSLQRFFTNAALTGGLFVILVVVLVVLVKRARETAQS